MPKITRIYGGNPDELPLRVTRREGNKKKAPSIRIKCACCAEAVVIFPENRPCGRPQSDSIEINGVHGSIAQWREILLPILHLPPLSNITPYSSDGLYKLHVHPSNQEWTVYGRRLRPGEVLQKGDAFNSLVGWNPISERIFGIAIENASPSIFIRPV